MLWTMKPLGTKLEVTKKGLQKRLLGDWRKGGQTPHWKVPFFLSFFLFLLVVPFATGRVKKNHWEFWSEIEALVLDREKISLL